MLTLMLMLNFILTIITFSGLLKVNVNVNVNVNLYVNIIYCHIPYMFVCHIHHLPV